jgi:UDP-N-acetylglucosamine acyltransferase
LIDPQAIVHPSAKLGRDVSIGPWSIVGADVEIGARTWVGPHVVIQGPTTIGADNRIFQFASIGDDPQDKKYQGEREETRLEIGDRNTIREYVTINRGTKQGGGLTKLGHDNWIMAYVHVAHDCIVGDNTIFANNASLAGHVIVEDHAILGGFALVRQFVRIGTHSFIAAASLIVKDVPPYMIVSQQVPAQAHGLNREGLRRSGFSNETINKLRRAYRILFRQNLTVSESLAQMQELADDSPEVAKLIEFVKTCTLGIIR